MRVVKMEYNPYKMKTSICIDGSDVKGNSNYRSIDDFIGRGTPLQTWVEPIDYLNWPGLLNEIADPENNGEIEFCFSGRKIDFEDLKRSLEDQNKNREEGTRLSLISSPLTVRSIMQSIIFSVRIRLRPQHIS